MTHRGPFQPLHSVILFSLENSKIRGDLVNVQKYLMGGSKKYRDRLFSVVPGDGTRGNGQKPKYRKIC